MNDNTNDQRLITIAEAAGILNVSEKTVHRIISIGRVHEITRNGQRLLREDEVREYAVIKARRRPLIRDASDYKDGKQE
jgi:excisionase family DNA binding protein